MIVTDKERGALIKQYKWIADKKLHKYKRVFDYRDWEELHADCMMAINVAITKHNPNLGYALGTMVRLKISQTIHRWFRNRFNDKQTAIRTKTAYVGDDFDIYGQEFDNDRALTLALLRSKNILNENEWQIMDGALKGYPNWMIGKCVGRPKVTVTKWRAGAVKKLQAVL
jgi:hypothetical protein